MKDVYNVEFYIIDAFEIYHFLPIYKALEKHKSFNPVFVVEPMLINSVGAWCNVDDAIKILENLRVPYSKRSNCSADIAFTTQFIEFIAHYKNLKFRLNYGIGLYKNYFSLSKEGNHGFDGILAHGNYGVDKSKKFISKQRIEPIGYPKHDFYFNHIPTKKQIINKLKIKAKEKKILVYLPTWDEHSSVEKFCNELIKLKEKFHIVVKPHHCTARGLSIRKDDFKNINRIASQILNEHVPISDIVNIADVIITDAKSGALTECMYLNPEIPIIALFPYQDLKKYFFKEIFTVAPVLNNPKKLNVVIEEILKNDKYRIARKKYSILFYNSNKGRASQDSINAIQKLLKHKQISESRKKYAIIQTAKVIYRFIINYLKNKIL